MVGQRYTWEEETLIINLYSRTPIPNIRNDNPEIIELCELLNRNGYNRTVSGIRNKMENLKSVDDEYTSNGRVGRTNMSKELRSRWLGYCETGFIDLDNDVERALSMMGSVPISEPIPSSGSTGRPGQDQFRRRVLAAYDNSCCISGIRIGELLEACHIKPYKICVEEGKLDQAMDMRNGLCMNRLHHRAFDQGLFGIDEDLHVILSPSLDVPDDDTYFRPYEGMKIKEPRFSLVGEAYLEYHRKNVFVEG